jgi:hypothetical protein
VLAGSHSCGMDLSYTYCVPQMLSLQSCGEGWTKSEAETFVTWWTGLNSGKVWECPATLAPRALREVLARHRAGVRFYVTGGVPGAV